VLTKSTAKINARATQLCHSEQSRGSFIQRFPLVRDVSAALDKTERG
jgi:hypothetical protein